MQVDCVSEMQNSLSLPQIFEKQMRKLQLEKGDSYQLSYEQANFFHKNISG